MFQRKTSDGHWMHISDLMSGLMIVFLLIAVSYMEYIKKTNTNIKNIVVAYKATQVDMYKKLMDEFKEDLPKWGSHIDKETLSVTFPEPDVLFKAGESNLSTKFKDILNNFSPRYINILYSDAYRHQIDEIRIEGHTSSEWSKGVKNPADVYFLNMRLSQERTRSVLEYCYKLIDDRDKLLFIKKYVTANGLSSSKPVVDAQNQEDKNKSRRVEFRTRTNAESEIVRILEQYKEYKDMW